jgi:hypothetical protein
MDNGVDTKVNSITITVYPAEGGFGCVITEPKLLPLTQEMGVALTIAHGMVAMSLSQPDIVFDEGVNSLAKLENDEVAKGTVTLEEMFQRKKGRLH